MMTCTHKFDAPAENAGQSHVLGGGVGHQHLVADGDGHAAVLFAVGDIVLDALRESK